MRILHLELNFKYHVSVFIADPVLGSIGVSEVIRYFIVG